MSSNPQYQSLLERANRGLMEAQKRVADLLYNGDGVPQDYAAAAHWYRRAAEQGDNYSHHSLGICYQTGRGVARDDAAAFSHFEKAAQGPKKIV
ncbi:tetratricopeptide repeat protein, partial [Verrucomicrobium sp. BvORR034]|uniref:tetratricopeptide repeat protein n=1 Tax=Verrucomicrobium sp. BvORR034 TaxID=1396418 RepID=UPI002240F559